MSVKNPWLSPYQRSYQDIKKELINKLTSITDEKGNRLITDVSEGNILIILISMFAAIAEVLNYYIDCAAREAFFVTARKYDSLVKQAAFVDYYPKAATAATVDLQVDFSQVTSFKGDPSSTILRDDILGLPWMLIDTINSSSRRITLKQHEPYNIEDLVGITFPQATNNLKIACGNLGGNLYEQGTMQLETDEGPWTLVDTLAYSGPTDRDFIIKVDREGSPAIVFGDNMFGKSPEPNSKITKATCYITKGAQGNLPANSFTAGDFTFIEDTDVISISNNYPSAGGSDYETFQDLQTRVPLHIRTQEVAITPQDYEDIAKLVPGVQDAKVDYTFGSNFNLYIKAKNNPESSEALIQAVHDKLDRFVPIGNNLEISGVGQVLINLDMEVTGNKGYTREQIQTAIISALQVKYSWDNSTIGGAVRVSDIYALIDNLPSVDYLHLNSFNITPWPVVIQGVDFLKIEGWDLIKCDNTTTYILTIQGDQVTLRSTTKGFYLSGLDLSKQVEVKDDLNRVEFKANFSQLSGNTTITSKYQFTVNTPDTDYIEPGYNVPVFKYSNTPETYDSYPNYSKLNLLIHPKS